MTHPNKKMHNFGKSPDGVRLQQPASFFLAGWRGGGSEGGVERGGEKMGDDDE